MQGKMLTELQLPKLEFKNQKSILVEKSTPLNCLLQESNECVKICPKKSLQYNTTTPSMVTDFTNTVTTPGKPIGLFGEQFAVQLVEKTCKKDSDDVNINSGVFQLPKVLTKITKNSAAHGSISSKTGSDAAKNRSLLAEKADISIQPSPVKKSSDPTEVSQPRHFLVVNHPKLKAAQQLKVRLNPDKNQFSSSKSLLLNSRNTDRKSFQQNTSGVSVEEPSTPAEDVVSDQNFSVEEEESQPFCVISEVVGNADAAFSGALESEKDERIFEAEILETPEVKNQFVKEVSANDVRRIAGTSLLKAGERSNSGVSLLRVNNRNTKSVSDVSSRRGNCDDVSKETKSSGAEVLGSEVTVSSKGSPCKGSEAVLPNIVEENTGNVTEVGTSKEVVSGEENFISEEVVSTEETAKVSEPPLITPKKTTDITKIKGWRRKQFLVEKPTTVEFYRISRRSSKKRIPIEEVNESPKPKDVKPNNVENAFTCSSLDEFLEREVDLKIDYDIPHLYAELGIKLTREEILSKPNFSETNFKEVEDRYRVEIPKEDVADLDAIDEESFKTGKRLSEEDVKPSKYLKMEEYKRRTDKPFRKSAEKLQLETKKFTKNGAFEFALERNSHGLKFLQRPVGDDSSVRLESKLLGLVVYPGPLQTLHPLVRLHLEKLRSYSTRIDKNWANFAASAVLANDECYKRSILPVYCCMKVDQNMKELDDEDVILIDSLDEDFQENEEESQKYVKRMKGPKSLRGGEESPKSTKYTAESPTSVKDGEEESPSSDSCEEKIRLKECCVVIDKIDLVGTPSPWCMEHNKYDCEPCGLVKSQHLKELTSCPEKMSVKNKRNPQNEKVTVLPQTNFNVKIANLLARKLRILKFGGDTLTSIDCLKTVASDDVEFIKLNLVQESFLSSNVRLWFMKELTPSTRSRAFLTFSDTPPVASAVRLKPNASSEENLPKIISEIVSPDKVFSPHEYAILHCNGEIWEIHGSLNLILDRPDQAVEQIFATLHPPELEDLKKVAQEILKAKAVKWWILDLRQQFRLIEIKMGNVVSILSRNKLIEFARYDSNGFIPLKRYPKGRTLGAYVVKALLPFVLMGPYYLSETNNMILKSKCSTLPFRYFAKEDVTNDVPLKYFINSVVKDAEENNKVLDGLWLYDKTRLDNTSYIEVLSRTSGASPRKSFSNIDVEHGYSLSSLTNSLPPGVTAEVVKRKDGQEEFKKIPVYMYFDIFELGYLEGELQRDNSVIINHPLDRKTKVKSHKIGDWFIRTIRRRIKFVPNDIEVKWFITRHKEDLGGRRPFNKFVLGGAHVLTKNGVFYLLEMSESKIKKLGLKESEVTKAITDNHIFKLVLEMKRLASLLTGKSGELVTMQNLLTTANSQIKMLESMGAALNEQRAEAEKERLDLTVKFLDTLNRSGVDEETKLQMIENVEHYFLKENGSLNQEFVEKLELFPIGQRYIKQNGKYSELVKNNKANCDDSAPDSSAPQETCE